MSFFARYPKRYQDNFRPSFYEHPRHCYRGEYHIYKQRFFYKDNIRNMANVNNLTLNRDALNLHIIQLEERSHAFVTVSPTENHTLCPPNCAFERCSFHGVELNTENAETNPYKVQVIRATFSFNSSRNIVARIVALQVEKRFCPYNHRVLNLPRYKLQCCKLKKMLQKSRTRVENLLRAKLSTMWLYGQQRFLTCNATVLVLRDKLKENVARITWPSFIYS